jgi:hypothetical protein
VDLYKTYKDRGFTILSVETSNRPPLAKEFTASVGATFPIVEDDAGISDKLFGVHATPTNLLIGRSGRIIFRGVGYAPGMEKDMAAEIEYLLKASI